MRTTLLLVLTLFVSVISAADAPPFKILAQRPDRLFAQLPNGLVVLIQRSANAPVVSVQCSVKTGSIYEQEFTGLGLSHYLEHLVAGGSTTTRTEAQSNALVGQIGGQTNASTGLDTVHYYINTTSDHADTAIDLLSDWMQHCKINPPEFDRERDVILREFAMGRGEPERIFWKLTQDARYSSDHPARHPTIGYEDEFITVKRDQVYDFYKRMYVPNNMVFVVTGDIDPQKVIDQIQKLWADSKPGKLPEIILPAEKPVTATKTISGNADMDRPRLRLAWAAAEFTTPDDYALDLLARILGDGELSRLAQTVRDEKGLVTAVEAMNMSQHWGHGTFGVDVVPEKGKTDEAKAAILAEVQRIAEKGVTPSELDRAKSKSASEVIYAVQTAEATAERLASDFIGTGDPDYSIRYPQKVAKVTAEQVQAVAKKYLQPQKLLTVQLIPRKGAPVEEKRPADAPPLGAKVAKGPDTKTIELGNHVLVEKMLAKQARREKAAAPAAEPMVLHKLPNGLRVLIQRNTRLPIVAMQWHHLGGLLADTPGREGIANATVEMLMKGAGERSADDIAAALENVGAQMAATAGNSTLAVSAQSLSKDWPTVLAILADVVQRPTLPEDQWRQMQPRLLAAIDSINDEWYTQLRTGFRHAWFGNHPWGQPQVGRREVVEKLSPSDLKQFHSRFAANDSVLAIVGDVDEKEALAKAESLFGKMHPKLPQSVQPPTYEPPQSRYVYLKTAKPTPAVVIGYGPGITVTSPDHPALQVMTGVLSSFPVGWLDQALRGEGQGLVYAVGAGIFTGPQPGYWSLLFNTRNETLLPALQAALAVTNRIRTETVDDATLARARQHVVVNEAFSHQAYAQLATAASLDELYGLGYNHAAKAIDQIRKVTAADVHNAATKYLQTPMAVILSDKEPDLSKLPPLKPTSTIEPEK